jgi:spore coat polysaccharide biosynthesis protein SpsF
MGQIETVIITQARTGSTRLPGKVLLKIGEDELLKIHLNRLRKCKNADEIIVATTVSPEDEQIVSLCKQWGIKVSQGSVNDVLDRFYQTVKDIKPKWVVRVTSDCPLIDPALVDAAIALAQVNDVDYCANVLIENFPDGQDIEVFKFSALEKAWTDAKLKSEREHVTPFIRVNTNYKGGDIFTGINLPCAYDFSNIRMTVDEPADFDLIKRLILDIGVNETWLTYTNYIVDNKLNTINADITRNEGLLKSLKND